MSKGISWCPKIMGGDTIDGVANFRVGDVTHSFHHFCKISSLTPSISIRLVIFVGLKIKSYEKSMLLVSR